MDIQEENRNLDLTDIERLDRFWPLVLGMYPHNLPVPFPRSEPMIKPNKPVPFPRPTPVVKQYQRKKDGRHYYSSEPP